MRLDSRYRPRVAVLIVPVIVILQLAVVPGFIERQGGLDAAGVTDGGALALSYILGPLLRIGDVPFLIGELPFV